MRVVACTIARLADAFADACRRQLEQPASSGDVFLRAAYDAQSVPPLVPRSAGDERLICGPIEAGYLGMADVDEDDAKLLKPDAQREVKLASHRYGESSVPGRSQEAVHHLSERLIDRLILRRTDRLEQGTMRRRKAQPGEVQDTLSAFDLRGAQRLAMS